MVAALGEQVAEDSGEEPRAEVLEGHRRAVEQLEHREAVVEPDGGRREVERVADEGVERGAVEFVAYQVREHADGNLADRESAPGRDASPGAQRRESTSGGRVRRRARGRGAALPGT